MGHRGHDVRLHVCHDIDPALAAQWEFLLRHLFLAVESTHRKAIVSKSRAKRNASEADGPREGERSSEEDNKGCGASTPEIAERCAQLVLVCQVKGGQTGACTGLGAIHGYLVRHLYENLVRNS